MKLLTKFLMGGLIGFIGAYGLLYFRDASPSESIFVYGGLALVVLLLMWSIYLYQSTKKIHETSFTGDEEDEAEERKYRQSSDFSTSSYSALVVSMILVAFTLIQEMSVYLIVASIVLLIVSLLLSTGMNPAAKFLYADREFPKADGSTSSDQYADEFLHAADEGERAIILQGLYKSHTLMNTLLVLAIILATTYSILQDPSQMFSVIMIGVVLIAGNLKYQLSIRNK